MALVVGSETQTLGSDIVAHFLSSSRPVQEICGDISPQDHRFAFGRTNC